MFNNKMIDFNMSAYSKPIGNMSYHKMDKFTRLVYELNAETVFNNKMINHYKISAYSRLIHIS